jgi:hypothetical protein
VKPSPFTRGHSDPGVITWQKHGRRARPTFGPLTLLLIPCAVIGGVILVCQLSGWIQWSGPLAVTPAAMLLVAISGQLFGLARAALRWFAG